MRKWIVGIVALLVVAIYWLTSASSGLRVETVVVAPRDLLITVQ